MDEKLTEVSQQFGQFKAALVRNDFGRFTQLKVSMVRVKEEYDVVGSPSFSNGSCDSCPKKSPSTLCT